MFKRSPSEYMVIHYRPDVMHLVKEELLIRGVVLDFAGEVQPAEGKSEAEEGVAELAQEEVGGGGGVEAEEVGGEEEGGGKGEG